MSKRQTETANTDPWRQNETEISPAGAEAKTESRGDSDTPSSSSYTDDYTYTQIDWFVPGKFTTGQNENACISSILQDYFKCNLR